MKNTIHNRRHFLKQAASIALGSSTAYATSAGLQLANALVQPNDSYKALVCIFLFGGNDAFNMVVPTDNAVYASYKASRQTLAIEQNRLLPLSNLSGSGTTLGFHPTMTHAQQLFNSGELALLTNAGALVEPTTKTNYQGNKSLLPPQLFSHNDQQTFLQSLQSTARRNGWAGRAADAMQSMNANKKLSMNISLSGSNIWQSGNSVAPYSIDSAGIKELENFNKKSSDARELSRIQIYQALLAQQQENIFQREYARTQTLAWELAGEVKTALDAQAPLKTAFPTGNPLAANLKMVAQMLSARGSLQVSRQTFFIGMGDFDTHGDQLRRHDVLLAQLSAALDAFYKATVELGISDQVTTFTMSDFGRTLTSNGDGTDHGWGSHQMIMGGAIKGGNIYGQFPDLIVGGKDDIGEGRIIPTTSMDQYAATLASWYGLPAGNFADVFPNLARFNSADLGFFKS
ncbi:DUF1501 domain-containing protein [Cellvibrio sp. OA-2007]|uniref:DUF1501 domain-containing protein n=1 Tax=Cellvibrio sp. OA-2007 TaxID=529823 RepID=UPI0007814A1E|nr:DUF1501 domain-containing protein [Cellvibrio sp. OA-2007]